MSQRAVIIGVVLMMISSAAVAAFMLMGGTDPSSSGAGGGSTTSGGAGGGGADTTPSPEWQSGPRARCVDDNTAITGIKLDKGLAANFEWTCGDVALLDTYSDQRMASNKVEYEDGTVKYTLTCGQGRVLRSVGYNSTGDNLEYMCHKRADADDIVADETRQKSRMLFEGERNSCGSGEVMQGIRTGDYICSK